MAIQKVPTLDGAGRVREKHLPANLAATALDATYAHPFMPEKYGAAATYNVAVDDTAAVQAAINAAGVIGGTVLLNRQYRVTALTITAAIKMHGSGGKRVNAANLRTGLVVNSATTDILTCSADGVTLEDFSIYNEVDTPTAGAGIRVTAGDYVHLSRLTVWNFYDNIVFDNGYYYDINACTILDPVRYGLLVRNTTAGQGDHGDQSVTNCVIAGLVKNRVHTASVKWESGGGLRFIGNKTNGSLTPEGGGSAIGIGLHIAVADGVSTSVFTIVGNSIEAWNTAGVLIEHAGPLNTGSLRKIVITGNEIAGNMSGPAVGVQMAIGGTTAQQVIIEGNTLGNYAYGITLRNVQGVTVGHNIHGSVGAGAVVTDMGGVTDLFVAPQTVIGDNVTLYGVTSMDSGNPGPFQQAGFDFHRETGTVASNSVYKDLWRITVPPYGAGRFKFTVAGNLNGVGAFVFSAEYLFTRVTGVVTATIIGTAASAGGVIDVIFDTATTSGEIRVGVKRNGANGTSFNGRARLAIDGAIAGVKKGA